MKNTTFQVSGDIVFNAIATLKLFYRHVEVLFSSLKGSRGSCTYLTGIGKSAYAQIQGQLVDVQQELVLSLFLQEKRCQREDEEG